MTDDIDALVRRTLREVAPDVPVESLSPDDDLRDTVGLDSLDFLRFVELLSDRTGQRIDEEDYPRLATIGGTVEFVGASAGR